MVGFYNYTVWLTYFSLASGITGIVFAASGNPLVAVICLIVCGIADMFDGKIARTRERTESEENFGVQIDSLCDVICFGVLPPMICYSLGLTQWYYIPVYVLFILCGVIRLAYFNVKEAERQEGDEKVFYGLPITNSALIFSLMYVFTLFHENIKYAYYAMLFVVAVLFVTSFKLKKPGKLYVITISILALCGVIGLILYKVLS